uniref:Transmembrane protein 213 n=1 Tax=Bos mutus grunniens TaxID=30521 RepID=A0A8B9WAY1_BOSMU
MKCLHLAPWTSLVLGLAFLSFHPVYLADVDFCPQAARCCHTGVDEYGWIAAAVGWSLLFLTLILLCVDKLMKLTPDESKDLQA